MATLEESGTITHDTILHDPNATLLPEVRDRVETIDQTTCNEWGGIYRDDTCFVQDSEFTADYGTPTVVRSVDDALNGFEKYTEWFEYVLNEFEPKSDACILLPCGATKPIGSSAIHQKKVQALKETDFYPRCDIIIISEPCTIVPHGMRLYRPTVNYDFPPEYTDQNDAPEVFNVFTDRIARFIDEMPYDTYYPYLVQGHQRKFDAAIKKADSNPRVVRIPGSSLGLSSHKLSGDLFKSLEDMTTKLEMIRALADLDEPSLIGHHDDAVVDFYTNREEYQPVSD